jgi:DNA polymerase I-like protein with 3'-5' exonuclease and polymerase domains
MVGFDASGLELRIMADVINDEDFSRSITEGRQEDGTDIHTKNQRDARLPSRDDAKTFIYAFIYGAGDEKLGRIIGGSRRAGTRIRTQFLAANPLLREAIANTKRAARRGYLVGYDGRKIHLRRDKDTGEVQAYKAFNTRLQTGGAIVMKWAMVILDHWVRETGMDKIAHKVIDMHDEAQWEVDEVYADHIGMMGVQAIIAAGVMLKLNVPLDAEYKVGFNWAMTH